MFGTVRGRAITILGLLAVLFGLAVWYGSLGPAPELGAYPNHEHLGQDYGQYLGAEVTVTGRVIATDPVTISADDGDGDTFQLTVTELALTPAEGEKLRVYGVAEPDHTIRAKNAFTVPQSGSWYAWSVSFLAGLWVLARIGRHWRLDLATGTLEPRETPLQRPLVERLRTTLNYVARH